MQRAWRRCEPGQAARSRAVDHDCRPGRRESGQDTEVPFGVRSKIAQDLLDRAGLIATQVHQIIPTTEDPIMRLFEGIFSDPNNWESNPLPDPTPAIESDATSSLDRHYVESAEILKVEIVEPEGEPANDTPPRIVEMIKSGAFDRKPRR
jgi:hypothetical protein